MLCPLTEDVQLKLSGCADGNQGYSVAILLEEAGPYARASSSATDCSKAALAPAGADHVLSLTNIAKSISRVCQA